MRGLLISAGLGLSISTVAHGAVVFTNLGAGDSYNSSAGLSVAQNFTAAGSFFPSAGGFIDSVDLGLNYNSFVTPNNRTASVALYSDASNSPGTLIENLSGVSTNLPANGTGSGTVNSTSSTHSILSTGTRYWIVLSAGPTNDLSWKTNTTSDPNKAASKNGANPWVVGFSNNAFRVNATLPEPTLAGSLAFVAGASTLRRRRRR